jgi:fibro-slime domain-containing protein
VKASRLLGERRGHLLMRLAVVALFLGSAFGLGGCGAKTDLERDKARSLELLPECRVPGAIRECQTICGLGTETCVDGTWQFCDAERPVPPSLQAVVRDFRDSHPDFERPDNRAGGGLHEPGIVAFELGIDDKPVYQGDPSTPSTTGQAEFDQWYRDVDGVNERVGGVVIDLKPSDNDSKLFTYSSASFFPIDGLGFGNEGRTHNYHFTLQLSTAFRYVGGETFSFSGDDDLWVFINRRLAIDLGGLHTRLQGEVDLDEKADELGIEVGEVYPLHLFFAERHTVASNFNIATTIAEFEFCE